MPARGLVAREVRVHGTVQGVFFRATCVEEAQRAGVRGWVRNEPDGTVSAHFEGAPDAVEQMVRWCREGSPQAEVTGVEATQATPEGLENLESFEQRG
ncbi:acylphosphatase [Nocardioidaceae bacterium]|nr:acylphosphatase [Nocardioidaceae bacterium]